nr:5180_t:CDS:2 [Entrophospora candida]
MKECGFFDCNNPAEKGRYCCPSCKNREEDKICSACRQEQIKSQDGDHATLIFMSSFSKLKKGYELISKLRNKVPARFQTQIDQVLPQLKLSQKEEQIVDKLEKLVSDFVIEKGGPGAFGTIFEEIKQEIGKENLVNITDEIEAEIFDKFKEGRKRPDKPDNNQEEINRLQRELNSLRQQIDQLRNSPIPPSNSDDLQRMENEIKKKEEEINRLKRNSPSNSQPSGDNPYAPLYFVFGAVGHSSPMRTTDIEKIVLNSGVGQAVGDKKFLENTEKALTLVAQGQKPVLTSARKSITTFKLREGMKIGCKVANLQGFSSKKFDRDGNYNLGIDNLSIFPTVPYDLTFKNQGVQVTIVFKSTSAQENTFFLSLLGFPFQEKQRIQKL